MEKRESKPEVDDLLLELDAEFGKKAKGKPKGESAALRNVRFHIENPILEHASGKLIEDVAGGYSWGAHRDWLQSKDSLPPPKWLPEARVTSIIHQHCAVCRETSWFTGNEYIRFRRNYAHYYKILGGATVRATSTVTRRIADCDPELIAQGLPDGRPLPEEIQEHEETVLRCPACVLLERACSDLWYAVTNPTAQLELTGLDNLLEAT